MVPLCGAGQTVNRGRQPPQGKSASARSPRQGSDKTARPATIFTHNGAPAGAGWLISPCVRPAAGNEAVGPERPARPLDLHLRRDLPERGQGGQPDLAQVQHRGDATPSGRNRQGHRAGTSRRPHARQGGIGRQSSTCPTTSRSCRSQPNVPNSIRSRTSGSSCATTGSQTASSSTTTTSSITAATPGTSPDASHGASCPSDCEIGRTSANQ